MMQPPPSDPAVEDALVPVSALQHYLFCPRQCALIHVERIWAADGATAEGRILHEWVDGGRSDRRRGVRTVRGIALRSFAHGLAGKAEDRKSVVWGKSVSVCVALGGRRIITQTQTYNTRISITKK